MKHFYSLYKAARVRRWHTMEGIEQNLAEHSWGVAMIVLACGGSKEAIEVALTHDLHEKELGDIPAMFKKNYPQIGAIEEEVADNWSDFHDYKYIGNLSDREAYLVQWADMIEAYIFSWKEWMRRGNLEMQEVFFRITEYMKDMPPPGEEAAKFLEELNRGLFGNDKSY